MRNGKKIGFQKGKAKIQTAFLLQVCELHKEDKKNRANNSTEQKRKALRETVVLCRIMPLALDLFANEFAESL